MSKKIICIDPGHGKSDPGAAGHGRKEKNDVLKLSLKIRDYLLKQDVKVIMTRTSDTEIHIPERCAFANKNKADYFLSVHRNSGGGTGYEIWVHSRAISDRVNKANNIYKHLTDALKISPKSIRRRGVKKGAASPDYENYGVNVYTNMPSALLEVGFIDSEYDNKEFDSKLNVMAEAIARALCENVGVKYVDTVRSPRNVCDPIVCDNIQTGTCYFYTDRSNINTNIKAAIKFAKPFKSVPRIMVTGNTGDARGVAATMCCVSEEGFSISFCRTNLGSPATSVDWIAIGE